MFEQTTSMGYCPDFCRFTVSSSGIHYTQNTLKTQDPDSIFSVSPLLTFQEENPFFELKTSVAETVSNCISVTGKPNDAKGFSCTVKVVFRTEFFCSSAAFSADKTWQIVQEKASSFYITVGQIRRSVSLRRKRYCSFRPAAYRSALCQSRKVLLL